MTVRIGNVELNDNLRLRGIESAQKITVATTTAFDGTVDMLTMPAPNKRELRLEARRDGSRVEGYFTLAQLQVIDAITEAGQPTTLLHDRGTFNVLITGKTEPVAIFDYRNPQADTRYVCSINMLEV